MRLKRLLRQAQRSRGAEPEQWSSEGLRLGCWVQEGLSFLCTSMLDNSQETPPQHCSTQLGLARNQPNPSPAKRPPNRCVGRIISGLEMVSRVLAKVVLYLNWLLLPRMFEPAGNCLNYLPAFAEMHNPAGLGVCSRPGACSSRHGDMGIWGYGDMGI